MLNWDCTKQEFECMEQIVARARRDFPVWRSEHHSELLMDINATHSNGNPLRLWDLLAAPLGDFAHDIFGIRKHIDRETGQMTDCFQPRFTDYQRLGFRRAQ